MNDLRDRIAEVACGATSAGKLFPWDTLSTANRQPWYVVADAVIEALGLTENGGVIVGCGTPDGVVG